MFEVYPPGYMTSTSFNSSSRMNYQTLSTPPHPGAAPKSVYPAQIARAIESPAPLADEKTAAQIREARLGTASL